MSQSLHNLFSLDKLEQLPEVASENLSWTTEVSSALRDAHIHTDPDDCVHLVISPERALFLADILDSAAQVFVDDLFSLQQEYQDENQEPDVHRSGDGAS